MAEDDPELWEALHRLTCVMHQMHDHDMLRTDWNIPGAGFAKTLFNKAMGKKTAPDSYAAGNSTVGGQKEIIQKLEKDIRTHEASLHSHEAALKSEHAQVDAKHKPVIDADKLAIANDKAQESAAQKAIDAANDAYTLEEKAKEAKSKADHAASEANKSP